MVLVGGRITNYESQVGCARNHAEVCATVLLLSIVFQTMYKVMEILLYLNVWIRKTYST